jgi:nucleotide-binding universal stress UspA family protein
MQKIIVAYDGSDHADRALDRAAEIASEDTEVVVVSAARLSSLLRAAGPVGGETSAVDPGEAESAREHLDKARARLAAKVPSLRTVEAHGDPADAVVRVAKDEQADLIAVGTRGLNVAQRALLGSVSTKIVHSASCDVLVVR